MSQCTAMSQRSKSQCRKHAVRGATVCETHGAGSPKVKAAAARRVAEAKAMEALRREGSTPVENPLEELLELGGEIRELKNYLGRRVEILEELRYRGAGGEQVRGELQAYERALDRSVRVLATIASLNLDARLVRIAEEQMGLLVRVIEASMSAFGFDSLRSVRPVVAHFLRAMDPVDPTSPEMSAEVAAEAGVFRSRLARLDEVDGLREALAQAEAQLAVVSAERDGARAQVVELLGRLRLVSVMPAPLALEAPRAADVVTDAASPAEPSRSLRVNYP